MALRSVETLAPSGARTEILSFDSTRLERCSIEAVAADASTVAVAVRVGSATEVAGFDVAR